MDMGEGYRRGTVLGLTIAEIFVLLVFLMLLALLGVNRHWSAKVDPWIKIMETRTPEEVEAALGQTKDLQQEIKRLKKQIEELEEQKEKLQKRVRTLENREGTVGEELDEVKHLLAECEKALEDARGKIETLITENQTQKEINSELEEEIETLKNENRRLRSTNSDLAEEKGDLAEELRIIGKGTTPPCWYQRVEDTNPITKANWREKAYYLFDIVIREKHMEVQPAPIPKGRAEDNKGRPYSEEAEALKLDETIPYGVPLTNEEMRNVMRHLHEKGKASEIRSYSCVFFVRVFDETPATAKGRWKRAHGEVLQQLFGTHQTDIPWSDRDRNPANQPVVGRREAQ